MNARFTETTNAYKVVVTRNDFVEVVDSVTEKVKSIKCSVFGYIPFNRAAYIDRPKFKKLQASINTGRMLSPIVCFNQNEELMIKDGQGRLVAVYMYLKDNPKDENGNDRSYTIPVYVSETNLEDDVVNMNNTASPWDLYDYIVSNRDRRDQNCQKLLNRFNTFYDYSYKTVTVHMSDTDDKMLYEGPNKWIPNFIQGEEILNKCLEFKSIDAVLYKNTTFTNGIAFIIRSVNANKINDIDKTTMVDKLKDHCRLLKTLKIADLKTNLLELLGSNFVVRNRVIIDAAKAEAFDRADGQCEAVLHNGARCTKVSSLEYHHDLAHASGGSNEGSNIRVLCKNHNIAAGTNPIQYFSND